MDKNLRRLGRSRSTEADTRGGRTLRWAQLALGLVMTGMALAVPAGAGADEGHDGGPYKGVAVTWADYLPCTGLPVEITATISGTAQRTSNGDGEGFTRAMHGTFSAVPVTFVVGPDGEPVYDPDRETYVVDEYVQGETFRGRFSLHNGAKTGRNASNETFTFAGSAAGSAGTEAQWHAVNHFTDVGGSADDAVLKSSFRRLTCK